jgi:hypothetical protein
MRKIYEWLDSAGKGVITDWPKLQERQRAKLESKLPMLREAEVDVAGHVNLPPNLLAGPGVYGQHEIYKMKIHGNVALRPMLCLGPIDRDREWTFLARAVEKDRVLIPEDAANDAETHRKEIIANPRRRRLLWEDDDSTQ